VPTILTTVVQDPRRIPPEELQNVFPDQNRLTARLLTHGKTLASSKRWKNGRKKLVIAALWTEVCLAMPVIHALAKATSVCRNDASGGVSVEAHERAVQRMVAGCCSHYMDGRVKRVAARLGARSDCASARRDHAAHGGSTRTSFAWELQLLGASSVQK